MNKIIDSLTLQGIASKSKRKNRIVLSQPNERLYDNKRHGFETKTSYQIWMERIKLKYSNQNKKKN